MDFEDNGSSTSSSSSLSSLDVLDPKHKDLSKGNVSETLKKRKAGRKKFKETRHPIYKGVRERNGGKWVCEVREPNKRSRIWLGTYPSPEMAARAHDVAAIALHGEKANLNFSDSSWRLAKAKSSSPHDIRVATHQLVTTSSLSSQSFSIDFQNKTSFDDIVHPFKIGSGLESKVESSKHVHGLTCTVDSGSVEMQNKDDLRPTMEVYVDEEVVFNMPNFYNSMAEGLVITPPAMEKVYDWDIDHDMDLTLWGD